MLSKLKGPNFNRTKIIATIGPASSSEDVLTEMIIAGVDICRLNFSHGDHEELQKIIDLIRSVNLKHNLHVCILCDLQGPKLRLGDMENGSDKWNVGDLVTFTTNKVLGTAAKVYITYPQFPKDVKAGEKILVNDGALELLIENTNELDEVKARVTMGGIVSSRKGVNLPNTKISLPSLTEKDLIDLEFALKNDVEWVGLSFVRSPEDLVHIKALIKKAGKKTKVVAKIEKPEAVAKIDEIIREADAVMVARGDLGVEMPLEQVPLIQKKVVLKCKAQSKPVIIATQMMESMIVNSKPTRAETNDVATAVLSGADAVMLSGETSVGQYPVQTIEHMDRIIATMEADKSVYRSNYTLDNNSNTFLSDAVCLNAVLMSKEVNAKAIISMTKSGYTAFKIASFRPEAKIYIFSDDPSLINTVNLIWGVRGFLYNQFKSTDDTITDVIIMLKESGHLESGDIVINTASMPIDQRARTNALKITVVD